APERFGVQVGAVVDRPVGLEDVMPTCLDFAGVPVPGGVDGRSLLPLLRGEEAPWREYIHIEHAPLHHTLTDGNEKYVWFVADGREQFFHLPENPDERFDVAKHPRDAARVELWRTRLVVELKDRPEGFSDGERLIPGRPYPAVVG
ncbi:MAG TPA: arylsulfatase, partial [Candidatus Latescibacteria bacterium]|nr:arylsulfatase [Candidatus Latescibacterota bacterium]